MVLKRGDKILLVHWRLFDSDTGRHFIDTVEAYDRGIVKIRGWTFLRSDTGFLKKPQERIKIMSLASDGVTGYELDKDLDLNDLRFVDRGHQGIVRSDGGSFEFDMTERPRAA